MLTPGLNRVAYATRRSDRQRKGGLTEADPQASRRLDLAKLSTNACESLTVAVGVWNAERNMA